MESASTATTSSANTGSHDLLEHFEMVVDADAEPTDWDDALASFLVAYVKLELVS